MSTAISNHWLLIDLVEDRLEKLGVGGPATVESNPVINFLQRSGLLPDSSRPAMFPSSGFKSSFHSMTADGLCMLGRQMGDRGGGIFNRLLLNSEASYEEVFTRLIVDLRKFGE